jgi:hypothetical protein
LTAFSTSEPIGANSLHSYGTRSVIPATSRPSNPSRLVSET